MPFPNAITADKTARLIATPRSPKIIDNLAPEPGGLLAISLGRSRSYANDLEQLETGLLVYDAPCRGRRDGAGGTRDWAPQRPGSKRVPA